MHDIEEIPPLDRFSPFREAHCHTACRVTVVLGSPAAPMHKAPAGVTPRSCRSCVQPLLFSTCSSLYTSPRPALEIQIQHLVVPVHYVLGFRIDLLATAFFTAWQTVTSPCRPQLSAFLASLCVIKWNQVKVGAGKRPQKLKYGTMPGSWRFEEFSLETVRGWPDHLHREKLLKWKELFILSVKFITQQGMDARKIKPRMQQPWRWLILMPF